MPAASKPRSLARSQFFQEPFYLAAKGIRKVAGSPTSLGEEEERKRWRLEKKQGRIPESAPVGNPAAETFSITSKFPNKEAQGYRAQPLFQMSEGRRLLLGLNFHFPLW